MQYPLRKHRAARMMTMIIEISGNMEELPDENAVNSTKKIMFLPTLDVLTVCRIT